MGCAKKSRHVCHEQAAARGRLPVANNRTARPRANRPDRQPVRATQDFAGVAGRTRWMTGIGRVFRTRSILAPIQVVGGPVTIDRQIIITISTKFVDPTRQVRLGKTPAKPEPSQARWWPAHPGTPWRAAREDSDRHDPRGGRCAAGQAQCSAFFAWRGALVFAVARASGQGIPVCPARHRRAIGERWTGCFQAAQPASGTGGGVGGMNKSALDCTTLRWTSQTRAALLAPYLLSSQSHPVAGRGAEFGAFKNSLVTATLQSCCSCFRTIFSGGNSHLGN